jgi:hypothetical protein
MSASAMSFREKSGWAMGALLCGLGGGYFLALGTAAWQTGGPVPTGLLLRLVIWSIIGSVVVQAVLAGTDARAAAAPADERERLASLRASHWSGVVLGLGAVLALMLFPVHADGVLLFHGLMASLMTAQAAEHFGTAWLLRRG